MARRRQSAPSESPPPRRRERPQSSSPDPLPRRRSRPHRSASPDPPVHPRSETPQETPLPQARRGLAAGSRRNLTLGSQAAPPPPPPIQFLLPSSQRTQQLILTPSAHSRTSLAPAFPSRSESPLSPTSLENRNPTGPSADDSHSLHSDIDDGDDGDEAVEAWKVYGAALERGEGLLIRLGPSIWIAQQWSPRHERFKLTYCHIYLIDSSITCDCNNPSPCIHVDYFNHHRPHLLSQPHLSSDAQLERVFCFLLDRVDFAAFSVQQTPGDYDSSKRVIVQFRNDGKWNCRTCGGRCNHVVQTQGEAVNIGLIDATSGELVGENARQSAEERERERQERALLASSKSANIVSISHLPRGPTLALRLQSGPDQTFPIIRSLPKESIPKKLRLDSASRCRCGKTLSSLTPLQRTSQTTRFQPFHIHTETGGVVVEVETMKCPDCSSSHRWIGPDLLEHGLFNFNNTIGFARELFDLFILDMTASETPFVAFFGTTTKHYRTRGSPIPFISASTFARAFFAFSSIHQLSVPLRCSICGDGAETVICDASVMGIEQSRLTGNLRPPTLPSSSAKVHPKVQAVALSPLTPESLAMEGEPLRELKKEAKKWLAAPKGQAIAVSPLFTTRLREVAAITDPNAAPLAGALARTCDAVQHLRNGHERDVLTRFLKQIFSDEMIFQAFPPRAYHDLDVFTNENLVTRTLEKECPIFAEIKSLNSIPSTLPSLVGFLTLRSKVVLATLKSNASVEQPLVEPLLELAQRREASHPNLEDWKITGSLYPVAAKRSRPVFPRIREDAGSKRLKNQLVGDRGSGSCTKHYNLYGKKNGLIGGLAGFWCPHGVCIGAHVMPTSEGRDDFFAALYCFREKAPKSVVYDYSCALGPYCMVRAPAFFENTRFYIDELHAKGHSTCTTASFIAPAMKHNSELLEANSSAAECGHATIGRIRKSLSYSSEKNGTILLWIAISVWNRNKLVTIGEAKFDPSVVSYPF